MTPDTIATPATPLHEMRNLPDSDTHNNSHTGIVAGNELSSRPLIMHNGHDSTEVIIQNPDGTRKRGQFRKKHDSDNASAKSSSEDDKGEETEKDNRKEKRRRK
jgi:hypothetical protein